jgi:hypothetical protein
MLFNAEAGADRPAVEDQEAERDQEAEWTASDRQECYYPGGPECEWPW